MTAQTKRLVVIGLTTIVLLLIPMVAMQFTEEVQWSLLDFIVGGSLLLLTGLIIDLLIRKVKKPYYRLAIILIVLTAAILFWMELAVGIFGSPVAGT